jgi:hypothetical protein
MFGGSELLLTTQPNAGLIMLNLLIKVLYAWCRASWPILITLISLGETIDISFQGDERFCFCRNHLAITHPDGVVAVHYKHNSYL